MQSCDSDNTVFVVLDCATTDRADFSPFNEDGGEVVAVCVGCWEWQGDAFFWEKFNGDPIAGVRPISLDAAAVSCLDVLALPLLQSGIVEDVFDFGLTDVDAEFESCVSKDGNGIGGVL